LRGLFHPFHHADTDDRREAALAIAKKRYAHDEITKAEFEELKKDLTMERKFYQQGIFCS